MATSGWATRTPKTGERLVSAPVRAQLAGPGLARPTVSGAHEFMIEDSLGYLINRAARAMAQQLADELRPAGVGIGQWAVLLFLWAHDGMSQAELELPTMVRTIDRMVRDGLITRAPDPDDRRVSRIYLTERGRSLRDALVPTLQRLTRRLWSG